MSNTSSATSEWFRVPDGDIPAPEDQIGTAEAIEDFGLTYRQLQGMWNSGYIGHWVAGTRVVLSRREIEGLMAFRRTVRPAPPPRIAKHTGAEK